MKNLVALSICVNYNVNSENFSRIYTLMQLTCKIYGEIIMDILITLVTMFGGLGMFLYGMELMGDGLKQGSGEALKNFLGKLTGNALIGMLTGTLVTAIIQSSTATIVLTVGLIGAGILNLKQAVSIVMGANIGTTVTAQLIRLMDIESGSGSLLSLFKPDFLAPLALIIGIILFMFVNKPNSKSVSMIFLGFGILFTGMISMTDAVKPLAQSDVFVNALHNFANMPLLGLLTGLVLTVIVQSSSAMVGILQALSATGAMTFNLVYPVIMGINLGTCVTTAMVCSIGSSKDAKRTGVVHIVFNTIGTVLFMIVMTILKAMGFMPDLWGSVVNSGGIADFQTVFNLLTAIVLLPFTGWLVKLACKIVKDDDVSTEIFPEIAALDEKLMISPTIALGEVNRALTNVSRMATNNVARSLVQYLDYDENVTAEIEATESRIDGFTDAADHFLIKLSENIETEVDKREHNMLMQVIRDVERIGDYASNFDESAVKLYQQGITFSDTAKEELQILGEAIVDILNLTVEALDSNDDADARRIEPLEEVIDDMVLLLKNRHTDRLCEGKCNVNAGIIFLDILTHLERAADQCSSIAMLLLGRHNDEILKNHHTYLADLHNNADQSYLAEEAARREQYYAPLLQIKS